MSDLGFDGKVAIITGAGGDFCAGADLTALVSDDERSLGQTVANRMRTHFNEVPRRLATADVPVVEALPVLPSQVRKVRLAVSPLAPSGT